MKKLLTILILAFLLRVAYLGSIPAGFYSDEAAFGYNVYLLLNTGRDEYGRFWPVSLESFGDWKPPMTAWLAIPFIKLFGLNEFSIRLPSAILGTATVAVVYFLAKSLLRPGLATQGRAFPELTALFLAINPWHIFMSRIAMLVAVEVFFVSLGVLGLLEGRRIREEGRRRVNWWWVMAAVSFVGAIYSYYGSRVTVPLILLIFCLVYFNEVKNRWREFVVPLLTGTILLSPILIQSIKQPLILSGRARTTSIFFNDNVRLQLWDAHTKAGLKNVPPVISRFFDNKLYYYARDIVFRYTSHFSPVFLFFKGDSHPPFKIPHLGYLHLIDLPFFLIGLWQLRKAGNSFPLLYLLAAPAVAALTFLTPAANRSFNLVIPWTLITAYGLTILWGSIKDSPRPAARTVLIWMIALSYSMSVAAFGYSYVKLIPQELPHYWHWGRRELVDKLKPYINDGKEIYLTNKGGPPYIFLSFYLPISPEDFHRTVRRNPVINDLGWGHVDGILGITIKREFNWNEVPKVKEGVYVGFEDEIPEAEVNILDRVYYPNGRPVYTLAKLK